jgi:hypothetical protein
MTDTNRAAAMAGEHDSATCTLGPDNQPCQPCAWANESERRQQPLKGLTETELVTAIKTAVDATTAEYAQVATVACVRAALFDVLDSNTKELYAFDCEHHRVTDEEATEARYEFVDAVMKRITELQAPPHGMDRRLLELVKSDLAEMRRLTKERVQR